MGKAGKQTDRQMDDESTNRQTIAQTDRHWKRPAERKTGGWMDRYTVDNKGRQADRQTDGRVMDLQTD